MQEKEEKKKKKKKRRRIKNNNVQERERKKRKVQREKQKWLRIVKFVDLTFFSKSALLHDYCNNNVNLHTFKLTDICDFFT